MEPIQQIRSRTVVLPYTNVDTDQIIPARFLRTTTRTGLGTHLFEDWRYGQDGVPKPDFPLNASSAAGCSILVAGRNFGCGSSREHAPWALLDFGIRAVVSTEIADIFRNNALKNGLLPVVVDEPTATWLLEHAGEPLSIDVAAGTLTLSNGAISTFSLERFARYCLLNGIDELGYLMSRDREISDYEQRARP